MNAQQSAEKRYSVAEMAAALGVTKNAIRNRANRHGWPFELASSKGGKKRLYKAAALPPAFVRKISVCAAIKALKVANGKAPDVFVVVMDGDVFEVRRLPA